MIRIDLREEHSNQKEQHVQRRKAGAFLMYSKIIKDSSLVSIQGVHSRKKKGRSVKKGGQTVMPLYGFWLLQR